MKALIVTLMLLASLSVHAQEIVWERSFAEPAGSRQGADVVRTADGGFLAVGHTYPSSGAPAPISLVRTDGDGMTLWERALAGHDSTVVVALHRAGDGFHLIGSTRDGSLRGDTTWYGWCAKLDANGEVLMEKRLGVGSIRGAEPTADGGFIITGGRRSEMLLMKLDGDCGITWSRVVEHGARAVGSSVRQTSDGGYIAVGTAVGQSGVDGDVLLVRADSTGAVLWDYIYPYKFGSWEDGRCVEETEGGGLLVAAVAREGGDESDRFGTLFMLGLDRDGMIRWDHRLSLYGLGDDSLAINEPSMSRRLSNGDIVICGASGPGHTMPFLFQIGSGGRIAWKRMLSDLIFSQSVAAAFRPLPDGGFIVTGTKMQQLFLMRLAQPASAVDREELIPGEMDLSWLGGPRRDR